MSVVSAANGPRSIVVFGEDWGRHPSSTQHMVARLARERDVIWVNSIGMRRPRLNARDIGRVGHKLSEMAGFGQSGARAKASESVQPVPERISILSPRAISWPGNALASAFNRVSVGAQIRAEIGRRSFRDPILWTSLPTALPLVGELGERGVVYYCGDDFAALEGVDHVPVAAMEQALTSRADMILACSAVLASHFPAAKTRLVPHGVDIELFQRPRPRPADMPSGDKIAGFYGSLAAWIDLEAIAATARSLPDWTFLLIGPARCDLGALAGIGNIRLLGEKPHHELPAYVQHWTVSMLPFKDSPQIRACNPLKLREYLAVGNPIVAPSFPALEPFRSLVEVHEYGCDFSAALRAAAGDTMRDEARRATVHSESWTARAAAVSALLDEIAP